MRSWIPIVTALVLGCGPTLLLPGGELDGPVAPTPSSWSFTDDVGTVQLETRPDDPYSVNIWATALDSSLYVHAGANRANWVENIEADPRVRVRIEDEIYLLEAQRVYDAAEFERFAQAYEAKYGSRPRNERIEEIYLYRLEPRAAG